MKTVTKVVSAALLAAAVTVTNAAEIKWSGAAQYRGRLDIMAGKNSDNTEKDTELNRSNKYAWKVGMKTTINENVAFGFQLENPSGYSSTNTVAGSSTFDVKTTITDADGNKKTYTTGKNYLAITQAYMAIKKGKLSFNAGIIPVKGNTALDLATHIDESGIKSIDMSNSWSVRKASSQVGAELGLKVSDAFAVNLAAATQSTDGKLVSGEEDGDNNKDDIRFMLNAPVKLGAATLTPALHVLSGKEGSWTSLSTTGGVDLKVKAGDKATISAGVAVGGYGVGDKAMGILAIVKPTFSLNDKMKLTTGVSFGTGKMRAEADPVTYNETNVDLKLGIKPVKNFTVMPRLRSFIRFNSNEDDDSFVNHIRPEILFIASF